MFLLQSGRSPSSSRNIDQPNVSSMPYSACRPGVPSECLAGIPGSLIDRDRFARRLERGVSSTFVCVPVACGMEVLTAGLPQSQPECRWAYVQRRRRRRSLFVVDSIWIMLCACVTVLNAPSDRTAWAQLLILYGRDNGRKGRFVFSNCSFPSYHVEGGCLLLDHSFGLG